MEWVTSVSFVTDNNFKTDYNCYNTNYNIQMHNFTQSLIAVQQQHSPTSVFYFLSLHRPHKRAPANILSEVLYWANWSVAWFSCVLSDAVSTVTHTCEASELVLLLPGGKMLSIWLKIAVPQRAKKARPGVNCVWLGPCVKCEKTCILDSPATRLCGLRT